MQLHFTDLNESRHDFRQCCSNNGWLMGFNQFIEHFDGRLIHWIFSHLNKRLQHPNHDLRRKDFCYSSRTNLMIRKNIIRLKTS